MSPAFHHCDTQSALAAVRADAGHDIGQPGGDHALLVLLYQPELLTTGPAAKLRSGKGLS